jgi:hypothetical protein
MIIVSNCYIILLWDCTRGGFSSPSNSSQPQIILRVQSARVHDLIFWIKVLHQNRPQKRWAHAPWPRARKIWKYLYSNYRIMVSHPQTLRYKSWHYHWKIQVNILFFRIRVSTLYFKLFLNRFRLICLDHYTKTKWLEPYSRLCLAQC